MCYQVRLITRPFKCMVTMRWVMAWLENGFGCSMKDERTCTMRREVGVHLWWMMIWCVRSTKECVTTDVSQFLICPCTFLRFQGLLYDIVSSHLSYRKVCARWVPKMLTEEHKKQRVASALTSLMRLHKEGDGTLSHIVTGDETWVSHIIPESKQQSLHWKLTGCLKRKKFKQTISTRKIMCTVFWDRQGVLLVEFLPQGTTINSAVYCEMLKKLRHAIQNKRRGMLSASILLLHDNIRPHSAVQTQDLNHVI